jgi:predicted transcriptional regulator
MTMNEHQIQAAQRIGLALLESIEESGELGAPAGILYAAMMAQGCSLNQFESLMAPVERRGYVTRSMDCYTITPSGSEFISKLRKSVEAVKAH